jgi:serine/threonine-protein kinase HipA
MTGETLRSAVVRLSGQRVGTLSELEGGRTRFQYDESWLAEPTARPVSLLMPLRAAPFESAGLSPFFANLLPEGWLFDVSLARLKIARDDAFGLLLATCADCMGEVEVVSETGAP